MRTYTTMDRTDWGAGPWGAEPDKLSWTDEATGLPCLIVRNHGGALCGYVGVAPSHPWHGVGYGGHVAEGCDAIRREGHCWGEGHTLDEIVDVHGGLTFASGCDHDADEASGICHIPDPGAPANVWWFGFDTAHFMDVCPGYDVTYRAAGITRNEGGATYKTVEYVTAQVSALAVQLKAHA